LTYCFQNSDVDKAVLMTNTLISKKSKVSVANIPVIAKDPSEQYFIAASIDD
jgi:hypothetical protein